MYMHMCMHMSHVHVDMYMHMYMTCTSHVPGMKTLSSCEDKNIMFMLPGDGTAASVGREPFLRGRAALQRLIQEYAWAEAPSNPPASDDDDDRDSVRLPPQPQPPLPPQADVD